MQDQLKQNGLEYKKYERSLCWDMSENVWDDFLAEKGCLIVPRELRLKRKELGLNNEEYAMLLDYLDCFNYGEVENPNQHLAELNGVSERTIQRRLGALEKKGLLRSEVRVIEGRIKGITYNPEPLVRKLKSLSEMTPSVVEYLVAKEPSKKSAHEPGQFYGFQAAQEQDKIKEKKWKDEFCSTRWYNDVFSEMYEEASGQPVLTGGREYKSAELYFRRLRQLNSELSAEDTFKRATEGARYMLDSQLRGGVFGWLHKPPDICMLANQAQAVDYQLRCIDRTYGEEEKLTKERSDGCSVEVLFTKKDKEKENASEQIERMYNELREIEQRDVRRDFQESHGVRLSEDKS